MNLQQNNNYNYNNQPFWKNDDLNKFEYLLRDIVFSRSVSRSDLKTKTSNIGLRSTFNFLFFNILLFLEFYRKVYGLLSAQLALTTGIVTLVLQFPGFTSFMIN